MIISAETATLHDLVQLIRNHTPDLVAVYLFGSHATDTQHAKSDIDIAILPNHELPAMQRWQLAQRLAAELSRDVDLVDLKQASTVMRMQVISTGRRLYCTDEPTCEAFEDFVFSDYARLNEERALILRDIEQRGSIYG